MRTRSRPHRYHGGSHILHGLSLEARLGEVTCPPGRDGVGKTTLLKCLMGLLPAGEDVVEREGKPHQRGRALLAGLTVMEHLPMGRPRFSAAEARMVPESIHEPFPVLREMKHRRGAHRGAEGAHARVAI